MVSRVCFFKCASYRYSADATYDELLGDHNTFGRVKEMKETRDGLCCNLTASANCSSQVGLSALFTTYVISRLQNKLAIGNGQYGSFT